MLSVIIVEITAIPLQLTTLDEIRSHYAGKQSVELNPEDRRKILFSKKFCAQCLPPGVRFAEKHNCSKEYACPENFTINIFKMALHVLVCD